MREIHGIQQLNHMYLYFYLVSTVFQEEGEIEGFTGNNLHFFS